MKKSALLLFTTMAIPALAISQTPVDPVPAPVPAETKPVPVLPGDPVPLPVVPMVPAPVVPPVPMPIVPPVPVPVVPPVPAPAVPPIVVPIMPPEPLFPRPVFPPVPAPPGDTTKPGEAAPAPLPTPDPRVQSKGKGKGRPEDKDKGDRKKPAPTEPAPEATLPVPEEKMKRPSPPTKGDVNAPPPAAPGIPTPAADPKKRPGVPGTRPVPPPTMPAQPPGAPVPDVTPPLVRNADPKDGEHRVRPERPTAQKPPSKETTKVLEDQGKRDRKADAKQAGKIEDKDDAKRLLMTILGGAVGAGANDNRPNQPRPGDRGDRPEDRFRHGYRPSVEEVGRTQQDRERNVGLMVQRFQGRAPQTTPIGSPRRDPRSFETSQTLRSFESHQTQRHTQFYEGNRRVVRYSSVQEIPPVIVASQLLNRVQVIPLAQSAYTARPQGAPQGQYYNEVPPSYTADDAYAVSYGVDPDSAMSRDDILFRQGSTDFADAYSYDLVIDVAEALNAPALLNETFVIEGHASAEGDYAKNLLLSQERAERISRELVRHGVSAERLMPVGYGETEAAHPANAGDSERRLDRRVMVFRMR
jgi:outer membrane protein OmpA-like peptidoglycan-associated protein